MCSFALHVIIQGIHDNMRGYALASACFAYSGGGDLVAEHRSVPFFSLRPLMVAIIIIVCYLFILLFYYYYYGLRTSIFYKFYNDYGQCSHFNIFSIFTNFFIFIIIIYYY
jgi:multisubunit Na+/H+ antiporter MnhB subunit